MTCGCGEVQSEREKTNGGLAVPTVEQRPDVAGGNKVCVRWMAVERVRESKLDDVTIGGFTLQPKIHNLFLYFPLGRRAEGFGMYGYIYFN